MRKLSLRQPTAQGGGWRVWGLVCIGLLSWGWAGAAHASKAALPASGQGCAPGWDQLLPAGQRDQPGACAPAPGGPARVLAEQMSRYDTRGTLVAAPPPRRPSARPLALAALAARRAPPAQTPRPAAGFMPVAMAPLIDRTAQAHDIDPLLLHAIARVESRHQPRAVSHAGAHGLMQVIVPTARRFGVGDAQALHDPQTNLQVSARYLKTLQQRFGNDLQLVLAAYNAGEGAVEKHGRRVPPYRETQGYVRKVLSEYSLLRRVSERQAGAALARYPL
ncbi:MAG: lytic transglycosylase domain-containing protein [Ottowia sp.]|uniref:lytic transglycosylase domain-containing protein n=1 Tax=Ottowia sp. TaxID=1898956 RepID=UPI0039E45CF9